MAHDNQYLLRKDWRVFSQKVDAYAAKKCFVKALHEDLGPLITEDQINCDEIVTVISCATAGDPDVITTDALMPASVQSSKLTRPNIPMRFKWARRIQKIPNWNNTHDSLTNSDKTPPRLILTNIHSGPGCSASFTKVRDKPGHDSGWCSGFM